MNKEDEKKNVPNDKQQVKQNQSTNSPHEDEDQHSYAGKLDHVEGQMNNGEVGGGIKKEEE